MNLTDPKVLIALISTISVIVGAIIGALSKTISAKYKIREIEEGYRFKLQDSYLEKARDYTESVYIPLSIALTKLSYAFNRFRGSFSNDAKNEFILAIGEFITTNSDLSARGANAFLTTELDETLQSFGSFISSSIVAENTSLKMIFEYRLPYPGGGLKDRIVRKGKSKFSRFFWSPKMTISMFLFSFSYQADEVLSAELGSKDFEERFVRDVHIINVLIKEVTLGAKARL